MAQVEGRDHERHDLGDWLDLAQEVARHHRQGRVLGVDPALVLRGRPPLWRRALDAGGPADDVVALAGAALAGLDPDDESPMREPLLEAAAGCLGADLPGLIRLVRSLAPEASVPEPEGGVDVAGTTAAAPEDDGTTVPGRRLRPAAARAGALLAVALAVALGGGTRAWWPGAGADDPRHPAAVLGGSTAARGDPSSDVLSGEPADVAGPVTAASWDAPILTVDVRGVRYRYRLQGTVDSVAWRDDAGGPTVVVTAGDRRWELAVPALEGVSATAAPR